MEGKEWQLECFTALIRNTYIDNSLAERLCFFIEAIYLKLFPDSDFSGNAICCSCVTLPKLFKLKIILNVTIMKKQSRRNFTAAFNGIDSM